VRSHRQPIRPLPVVLPPLPDELLSSWINRHAAFIGLSGGRLLRHYNIEVPTVRDLDLSLSRRHAVLLADILRCSPHLIRNMTQSRGGRVRSRLVAIRQPPQICRACAHRHAANALTRGTRLRSWMEGWRITCPVCGAALEDFRLYMRLFQADPSDALLVQIESSAREGERIMDRASRRRRGGMAHTALMRSLLLPQAPKSGTRVTAAVTPRLLNLVVPESEGFFQRLPPENWPCTARMLPLSMRAPVLAGVAAVSSRPEYWVAKLVSAAAPSAQAGLMHCIRSAAFAQRPEPPPKLADIRILCGNLGTLRSN
jgi:TniQ